MEDQTIPAVSQPAEGAARQERRRRSVIPLVLALLLLLLLLCGLLWIYQSFMQSPQRRVQEAESPGIDFEWGAYQYRDTDGKLVDLNYPVGAAYDGDNKIYVTMPRANTIAVFDANGRNGRVFVKDSAEPKASLAEYQILYPTGVDVDEIGNVYVCSTPKASVTVFSPQGEKLRDIRVMSPVAVHVTANRVYVLGKGTLFAFDREGNPVGEWGTYGRSPEQLAYPAGVTTREDGTILVSDTNNYRIVALSPDLEPVWVFGKAATTQAQHRERILGAPEGIAVGEDGNAYVVDLLNSHLRVFDRNGNMIGEPLGGRGQLDNQFYFPTGIDHLDNNLFAVADSANNRVLGLYIRPAGDGRVTPAASIETTAE